MSLRVLAVLPVGALAATCTTTETQSTVVVPAPSRTRAAPTATRAGPKAIGSAPMEAAARRRARMAAGYAEARMAADAQEACLSYGLIRGTERFDRRVSREIDYRRPT